VTTPTAAPKKEKLVPGDLAGLSVAPVKDRLRTMNILIYGESGVGKSILSASADAVPEMRPVLVIDIEGGTLSLTHTYPEVHVVRVKSWKELQLLYNELHAGNHNYRTIVIDSLTETQKFGMYSIMRDVIEKDDERDPDIPSMREWGKNIEQTRRLVRGFRDLEMNTIFTALAKSDKDQRTGTTTKKPYLSGKLADEVAAFLDIVVYYYVKNVQEEGNTVTKRLLLTTATDTLVAKDRSGKLPMVIESPTMKTIYKATVATTEEMHV
jgi:hypothetical protein